MAAASRDADSGLERLPLAAALLGGQEYRFSFFQASRLLDLLFAAAPESRIGRGDDPQLAAARFCARASLAFPASELYALGCDPEDPHEFDRVRRRPVNLDWRSPRRPVRVTVNFMGLTGPQGVMPLHYSELVIARQRQGDPVLREFFDLFNNRLIAFFYRAWSKHRVAVEYEWAYHSRQQRARGEAPAAEDGFSRYLSCLIGLGTEGLAGRLTVQDESLRYYVASLASRRRSATALRELLADYLGLARAEVRIAEFLPQRLPLPLLEQTRLGSDNFELGTDTVLGDEVVLEAAKFEVELGPLRIEPFLDLLPQDRALPSSFKRVVQLVRFFVGLELDFDVRLVLRADQVFGCVLGEQGDQAPRLGVSTWVFDRPPTEHLRDSVFASTLAE